ncbi:MAG: trehalose-6-phosphate synthase [Bryobacteraceae bacterium]
MTWTRETLREWIQQQMRGLRLIVVSNRAPYVHRRVNGVVECVRPASGMAAALEPVMRACGGVWVAQGTGDADAETCGSSGRLRVPPEDSQYTLRRVFLPPDIESGFYNGLANGGLWPLCHITFNRPRFDPADWNCYRLVNEIFADAVIEEAANEPAMVFVQDYHFALLPLLLKERNPNLVIGHFWHIPWPNPEIFRVFPWQRELMSGMLGNDLVGFHLRRHCVNFLDTVDQTIESLVDHVGMEIRRGDRTTLVRPFPISIDFEQHSAIAGGDEAAREAQRWMRRLGNPPGPIGIGIDRVDYTKGIPERLRAIESLLLNYPEYRGSFQFVQIGVPSREGVPEYRRLAGEIDATVDRINGKWSRGAWKPVVYFHRQYSQVELMGLHRLAAFCMVNSLHDGMNLVAKEFIASRSDEEAVLMLSQFAGAASELPEALIFNPFDLDETRETIRTAIEMRHGERRRRMQRLRESVASNDVYRWAGKILSTLSRFEVAEEAAATACLYAH